MGVVAAVAGVEEAAAAAGVEVEVAAAVVEEVAVLVEGDMIFSNVICFKLVSFMYS